VALLDVLGFSALVAKDAEGEGVERYLKCLQRATAATAVNYVVFSDSIVLTVGGDGPDSLLEIASACSRLMSELLAADIPIRGAISHGAFVRSSVGESVFVAGGAVIDAYQFEQAQDWIGIMIAPSALARVPDLKERCQLANCTNVEAFRAVEPRFAWAAFVQPCHTIPFRTENPFEGSSFDGFAVVPTSGLLDPVALRDSIKKSIDRMNWLRAIAPTPASQRKYQQATSWLGMVQPLWHEVAFFREQGR
jgi:hypothetical protein